MKTLLVLLACLALPACGEDAPPPDDPRVLDMYDPAAAGELDRMVLDRMRAAGADLSKPTDVRWYLYFPTKPAAQLFMGKARVAGWKADLSEGETPESWLCQCSREAVPSLRRIAAMRKELATCAVGLKPKIDGWEAAITK